MVATRTKPTDESTTAIVGKRIRDARTERRMSLRALAERSGLSAGFLSQVERDLSSISLTSLRNVAAALDKPIVSFVQSQANEGAQPTTGPVLTITRASDGPPDVLHSGARTYEFLSSRTAGLTLEPLIAHFAPGDQPEERIAHQGEEFAHVLSGELTYLINDDVYLLRPGDSIHLVSNVPHSIYNSGIRVATVLSVLTPRLF